MEYSVKQIEVQRSATLARACAPCRARRPRRAAEPNRFLKNKMSVNLIKSRHFAIQNGIVCTERRGRRSLQGNIFLCIAQPFKYTDKSKFTIQLCFYFITFLCFTQEFFYLFIKKPLSPLTSRQKKCKINNVYHNIYVGKLREHDKYKKLKTE